jgi:hypothetical protein
MIINIREKINRLDDQQLILLDNDLNKKPDIIVENLMGLYCGDNFSFDEIEEAILEINLRMNNHKNNWRLPKNNEIKSKTFDRLFWIEEDPISNEKKSLFMVMNI